MNSSDIISWFELFYVGNCDGDWEHQSGITITTIDNPGWSVTVDIEGTVLERASFSRVEIEKGERDWVQCWIQDSMWQGRGGPRNLHDILDIFRRWAELYRAPG
jgi:Immunity protein 53